MQFVAIVAPAEVTEYSRQIGRRFETPTIVVNALSGEIDGIVAEPAAIFGRCAAPPERTSLQLAREGVHRIPYD